VYSIPAPLTSSPKQFWKGAALCLRIQGMSYCSVILLPTRGTEQPVSSRIRIKCCLGPHEMIMVVIDLLPQCCLFINFSGKAGLGFSLLCCLSCGVPISGSQGPFHFRFVLQIIGKDFECGVPRPRENPPLPHSSSRVSCRLRLPAYLRPRFSHWPFWSVWWPVPLWLLPPSFFSFRSSLPVSGPPVFLFL